MLLGGSGMLVKIILRSCDGQKKRVLYSLLLHMNTK